MRTFIFLILYFSYSNIYSQISLNASTKNILTLDAGIPLIWGEENPVFLSFTNDSTGFNSTGLFAFNSLGVASNQVSLGLITGGHVPHSGWVYFSTFGSIGYNWMNLFYPREGLYYGGGIRATLLLLVIKAEYQRNVYRDSYLYIGEIGVGF